MSKQILEADSGTKIFALQIQLNFRRGSEQRSKFKTHAKNLGLALGELYMRKVLNFQVLWKKVVQGSCCQFEKLFFLGGESVYFAGPEPLPWAFFANKRGRLTCLHEFDLCDLEQPFDDLD